MAGSEGVPFQNDSSDDTNNCAKAAEAPLPQARILLPFNRQMASICAAVWMLSDNTSAAAILV